MLGGMYVQIPCIKKAVEMGFYTITADYLPDNPGHKFANEYHNVSIIDKDAIVELAKKLKVDGVVCYANDIAVTTAAYVCEKMGFPTSPYKSVDILSNKDKFRAFLQDNGFNCPKAKGYADDEVQKALYEINEFSLPVVVKPVDSGGCKGITILNELSDLKETINYALSFSRSKRFIIEEYVEKDGYQVGGDGFTVNGELVFRCFSNSHFDAKSDFIPFGESFPYINFPEVHTKIHNEFQRLFRLLNMKDNAYNLEARVNKSGDVYIMEAAPRNGGALMPQVIQYATGVDMAEYTIKAAMGMDCSNLKMVETTGYWAEYEVHSFDGGILKDIWIEDNFKKNNIVEFDMLRNIGDKIEAAVDESGLFGIMILKFASEQEMMDKMNNIHNWVKVVLE